MTPPTPDPPSPSKRLPAGRRHVRVFALVAVAGLALSTALVALSGAFADPATAPMPDPAPSQEVARPESIQSSALAQLSALPVLPDAAGSIGQATAASEQALGEAQKPLAAALASAKARLESLGASGPLAAVPLDYVPGTDLEDAVKLPPVVAYPLPTFSGSLDVGDFAGATVRTDASPVAPRGFHLPATGVGPVDALAGQAASAFGTLQGALEAANATLAGGLPLGELPTDALPVEDLGVGLPTGLPGLGFGSFPGQAQGASDAADPDEEGAALAGSHAAALLKSAEDAFAASKPSLAGLLAGYQGLPGQVQALVDEAHNATQQAKSGIQAELVRRVTAIQDEGERAQKDAVALVASHRKGVENALDSAKGSLEDTLDAQVGAVQAAVREDTGRLQGLATQLSGQVDATRLRIQSIVDGAVANLSRVQDADTTAAVEAIQAAGVDAVKKVTQEGQARTLEIKKVVASLQARGEATVRQLTQAKAAALATLEGEAEEALARTDEAKEYLVGMARAKADVAEAAETAAATLALGKLPGLESARVAKVTQAGLALVASSGDALQAVEGLVEKVADATSAQVEKDIRYVEDVSKDYAKVPTGERMERAKAWSTVASLAEGRLGQVLDTTGELAILADKVARAADDARAEIEAMA